MLLSDVLLMPVAKEISVGPLHLLASPVLAFRLLLLPCINSLSLHRLLGQRALPASRYAVSLFPIMYPLSGNQSRAPHTARPVCYLSIGPQPFHPCTLIPKDEVPPLRIVLSSCFKNIPSLWQRMLEHQGNRDPAPLHWYVCLLCISVLSPSGLHNRVGSIHPYIALTVTAELALSFAQARTSRVIAGDNAACIASGDHFNGRHKMPVCFAFLCG